MSQSWIGVKLNNVFFPCVDENAWKNCLELICAHVAEDE